MQSAVCSSSRALKKLQDDTLEQRRPVHWRWSVVTRAQSFGSSRVGQESRSPSHLLVASASIIDSYSFTPSASTLGNSSSYKARVGSTAEENSFIKLSSFDKQK